MTRDVSPCDSGASSIAIYGVSPRHPGTSATSMAVMPQYHLPRGTRVEYARLAWRVEADRKATFERVAQRVGVSGAVFFERLIDHLKDELDADGVPSWWDGRDDRQELPLAR